MEGSVATTRGRRTVLELAGEKGIEDIDGYLCILDGEVVDPSTEIGDSNRAFLIPIVSGG
ncbi:MAG: hypothetical protein ACE5KV_05990 [Thermoplasmata archaeon]